MVYAFTKINEEYTFSTPTPPPLGGSSVQRGCLDAAKQAFG